MTERPDCLTEPNCPHSEQAWHLLVFSPRQSQLFDSAFVILAGHLTAHKTCCAGKDLDVLPDVERGARRFSARSGENDTSWRRMGYTLWPLDCPLFVLEMKRTALLKHKHRFLLAQATEYALLREKCHGLFGNIRDMTWGRGIQVPVVLEAAWGYAKQAC